MKKVYPLYGIVTVLNTPFTPNNSIDETSLRTNVDVALNAGVSGFLVPALASEVKRLTIEERVEMVRIVMDQVNNRVPVVAGAGDSSIDRSRRIIIAYNELGCENVLIQMPFKSEEKFYEDFLSLADLGPEMIMLQDWDPNGYGLTDNLICKLFEEVKAFQCLKIETSLAGLKYSRILKLTKGRLNVSGGWAVTQMIEGLKRGVHAFMPTGMHFIYSKIYRDYKNGNYRKAKKLFYEILPVVAFSNQHLDISIHFFKRLLFKQGIYSTPRVRQPITIFDEVHKEISNSLIDRVMQLEEKIKRSS